ncbi:mechanosensitive ion channel family protein [Prevotella sp. KH2C16]|uniref:mechanosensitive ion channel family protein n=1 Tax=Prevotella sp. KH2C16 TaxID=1855325 RepID=UPI0008EB2020|nr:mechanosensitive ion channel domain-containing protein [Prevotella sp. KH2C16]SFG08735.1 Small-conductance mechanosensitive channel [Prevotella sp. KH2C16]
MRKLLFIFALLASVLPANAVLKERDIASTLSILRQELTRYHSELIHESGFLKEEQDRIGKEMFSIMNSSNQNSLMLYSQKTGYIFDLTYACHEATEQYQKFQETVRPFRTFVEKNDVEIARYDSLVNVLGSMYAQSLSERAQIDRNVCLTLAVNIRRTLQENNEQQNDYIKYYKMTSEHLKALNDYANKRYYEIQTSIFSNGGDSYFKILSNLHHSITETKTTLIEKYRPQTRVESQWDSRLMFGLLITLIFFGFIATSLNIIFVRYLFTKMIKSEKLSMLYGRLFKRDNAASIQESFLNKRKYIVWATTVITFAVLIAIVRLTWDQNFFIMASDLLVEYTWLLGVILISLLVRLEGDQIKSGFRIYVPLMVVDFIVISFRIVLVPNDVVNLLFPPILLVCTWWQWRRVKKHGPNIPKSDGLYANITLVVFLIALIASWIGYTLLSVEILIWWIMQLTCILTLICISGLLKARAERNNLEERPITETWFHRLLSDVVLPILGVASIILSIYWAADVFNLSDTTWRIYTTPYINSKNIQVSIFGICQAIILFFLFSYINKTLKALMKKHFEEKDRTTAASKMTMAKNVMQVIVWGFWLIFVLTIFHVNNTWLVVVSGGFSTGVGFAMKDILENIYYGVSLMMGRIKVGDLIECDGIRGRVSSINYTSTMMDTIDGSVIAFQNSQLFTKNYKNLTKNHGYELAIIPVGVAYGSNIKKVKDIIYDAVDKLGCRDRSKEVKTIFVEFGDNSINFKILVWVPVLTRAYAESEIMEAVYDALNENNISIPFPQRDIHIIPSGDPIKHVDSEEEAMEEIKSHHE